MTNDQIPTAEVETLHGSDEVADKLCELAEKIRRGEIIYFSSGSLTYDGRVLFYSEGTPRDGYDYLKILGMLDVMKSGVRSEIQDLMVPEGEESV